MLIPKSFKLVNRTWKVRIVSREVMCREAHEDIDFNDAYRGLCDPYQAIIFLRKDQLPDDLMHSFWHEVGHALEFAKGNYSAKAHDEKEIDKFGGLMAQFWTTCKGGHAL